MKQLAAFAILCIAFTLSTSFGFATPIKNRTVFKIDNPVIEKTTYTTVENDLAIADFKTIVVSRVGLLNDIVLAFANANDINIVFVRIAEAKTPAFLIKRLPIFDKLDLNIKKELSLKPPVFYLPPISDRAINNRTQSFYQYWRDLNVPVNIKI